jgi:phage portal protein BeeE
MNEKYISADIDFIESRRFFRDEICKAFCVRPHCMNTINTTASLKEYQNLFNRFCESMVTEEFNLLEFAEFCRQYDDSITDLQARKILKTLEHANIIKYTGLLHFKKV